MTMMWITIAKEKSMLLVTRTTKTINPSISHNVDLQNAEQNMINTLFNYDQDALYYALL